MSGRPPRPVGAPPSRRSPASARAIGNPVQTAGLRDRLLAQARLVRAGPRSPTAASRAATARWPARRASARASSARPTSSATKSISERIWDSCFSPASPIVAGGDFRTQPKDRYRQWLTHKFASWWDQFGQLRAASAADAASPGARSASTCARSSASIAPAQPEPPTPPVFEPGRRRPPGLPTARSSPSPAGDARHDDAAAGRARRRARRRRPGPVRDGRAARPSRPRRSRSSRFLPPDGLELTIRAAGTGDHGDHRAAAGRDGRLPRPGRHRLAGRRRRTARTSSS